MKTAMVLAVGVLTHAGCGGLRTAGEAIRLLPGPKSSAAQETKSPQPVPPPTLEEAIGKTRRLMAEARPPDPDRTAQTLENADPEVIAAVTIAAEQPTAENNDKAAALYYRRGLLDRAYDYSRRAVGQDPALATAHERLARIWRDWGLPHLALADVHRAVYHAPMSASARNTLGTILQSLGQRDAARRAYMMALELDKAAAYAYNNLCYLSFLEGRSDRAAIECETAISMDPQLTAARNNLALTYAASGRPDLARRQFALAAGPAGTAFNMGILYLSLKRYDDAAGEFATAHAMSPLFAEASRRAAYARMRAIAQKRSERGSQ